MMITRIRALKGHVEFTPTRAEISGLSHERFREFHNGIESQLDTLPTLASGFLCFELNLHLSLTLSKRFPDYSSASVWGHT